MATDKNTIGVTTKAQKVLDQMAETGVFPDQMDAAKFAMSIAIRRGAKPAEVPGAGTKWNVGSFDPDNELRNLIPIIFPNVKGPYRAIESLIDSGLDIVARDYLKTQHFDFAAVLQTLDGTPKKNPGTEKRSQ